MNEENEDISDVMRQRTSREEVRRRNREVMERANAELRNGKSVPSEVPKASTGKEYSRFGLIRQSREGTQTLWVPYEFHSSMPELVFGPVKVDIDVDPSRFAEFSRESARLLFTDCLKNTCLVDPASIAFLDLVNPEEAFKPSSRGLDPQDEPLMTNDLTTVQVDSQGADGIYTGHFLRKPQLMSNDLFTEGNRNVGSMSNKFSIPKGDNQAIDGEFEAVRALDGHEIIYNPISKTQMRAKRVFSIFPDESSAALEQFKFDDKAVESGLFNSVLDRELGFFENTEMVVDGSDTSSFPKSYAKRRRYSQTNKSNAVGGHDEFYLLTIPEGTERKAYLKQMRNKRILKRDMLSSQDDAMTLRLVSENREIDS